MSVEHATFTVERTCAASPARVFAAFADPVQKARWFGPGTRLILTEQGVFLDGLDQPADREKGTNDLMDKLGTTLG